MAAKGDSGGEARRARPATRWGGAALLSVVVHGGLVALAAVGVEPPHLAVRDEADGETVGLGRQLGDQGRQPGA